MVWRRGEMGSKNQFDLLVDVDNDDPSHLIAAAEKKAAAAAASPKLASSPAPAPAKLPTKPAPPAQAGEYDTLLTSQCSLFDSITVRILMEKLPDCWIHGCFSVRRKDLI